MPITLSAAARAVGGTLATGGITARVPVESVAHLSEIVVGGHPGYAILATGDLDELLARRQSAPEEAAVLDRVVLVTDRSGEQVSARLHAAGISAITGCRLTGEALHATLSALVSEDRAASDRLVSAGMKVLTQAARRGGASAVISELAHRITGWAVLLDAQGQLITSAGAGRLHLADATAVALGRPVRIRHDGLQLHQVGSDRDRAGSLVISTRSGTTSHARDLASLAAELFDLLLRSHDSSTTEELGREALMSTLLAGGPAALDLLRRWGVHDSTLTGFALGSRTRTIDADRLLRRWLDELGAEYVFSSSSARMLGFVRSDLIQALTERVENLTPFAGRRLHIGVGEPAAVDALADTAVQARQALETALAENEIVVRYARLPSVEFVLGALPDTGRAALVRVLDPLRDASGAHGELLRVLRVFLASNGQHRASARDLGMHRQTLAARLSRIEELTGLSLERADDRATAWMALRGLGESDL